MLPDAVLVMLRDVGGEDLVDRAVLVDRTYGGPFALKWALATARSPRLQSLYARRGEVAARAWSRGYTEPDDLALLHALMDEIRRLDGLLVAYLQGGLGGLGAAPTGAQRELTKVALEAGVAAVAGSSTAASSTVAGLLAAAGVSTTVPVAGWVTAGGLAAAAATIALVGALRRGKAHRDDVVALAKKLGVADAEEMPAFTSRVIRADRKKREKAGDRYAKAVKRSKGKHRERLETRLRILAAVELLERAEAARTQPPPSKSTKGGQGAEGGQGAGGFEASPFGAATAAELTSRYTLAKAGKFAPGGVIDPREAAAFVYGYAKAYVAAKKGKITAEQLAKVTKIGGSFVPAASKSITTKQSVDLVLNLSPSGVIDKIKVEFNDLLSQVKVTGDPDRTWAIQVLQHAAALFSAAAEPDAAKGVLEATGLPPAQVAVTVPGAVVNAATNVANALAPAGAAVTGRVETALQGAVNVASAAVASAQKAASDAGKKVVDGVEALAAQGKAEVKEALQPILDLGKKLEGAAGAAREEIAEKLEAAGAKFHAAVAKAEATVDATQQAIVGGIKSGLAEAKEATAAARSTFEKAVDLAKDVGAKAGEVPGKLLKDPCSVLPAGSVQDRCRKVGEDACSLFTPWGGPWLSCKVYQNRYPLLGIVALLSLLTAIRKFRGAGGDRVIIQAPAPRQLPGPTA